MFKKIESLKELKVGAILKPTVGNKEHKNTEFEIVEESTVYAGLKIKNLATGKTSETIDLHVLKKYLIKA